MFDKFKEMNELRKLQNEIKKQVIEVEKEGVKVRLNGAMEVLNVTLNPDNDLEQNARLVKECFNEGLKKLQQNLAKLNLF